jgi:hypothetical protein
MGNKIIPIGLLALFKSVELFPWPLAVTKKVITGYSWRKVIKTNGLILG